MTTHARDLTLSLPPTGWLEFGAGCLRRLPGTVSRTGHRRAFVVTDPGLRAAGLVDRVTTVLAESGIDAEVHDAIPANPSTTAVDTAAQQARAFGEAAVVALGGGSALDAAKGVALLSVNPGSAAEFDYRIEPERPGLPLIAIPTTAGTGAETNGFGVIEDTRLRRKVYIGHDSVKPVAALLDPELTLGLPPGATAATGMDALVHGIESLASRGANPLSQAYAAQAIALVSRWLPVAVENGSDLEARSQMLLGAHLAGLALSISGLGLVHGIAHAVSARVGAPHGLALSAVLPEVMAWCAPHAEDAFASAAHGMGVGGNGKDGGNGEEVAEACRELSEQVGARRPLSAYGVTADMVPDLARTALEDAVTANSPRTPTEQDITELITSCL
ncbi:iron-containing alcohol dehydrogenase family protein [Wenjunlia tyrosinilytica]|uniref:Methanol dehydrogenase n=1 Tax=Wenjunlia tyrosinilytica TaxID=1544741 RepID=A0A917ZT67_9ACTN|nr:iron-containing alcohol dehydrogenase [Wenjunlia tyrosinilytica]GGO90416.1 methanol dehydrogenase [Wenjunlia tyrosinilytica]